jgi:hypothetical protein
MELELQRSLIGDPSDTIHDEIDLSALTRDSYSERWAAQTEAVKARVLLPDEVREIEGFNPLPKGARLAPAAVVPGDAVAA